MLTLIELLIFLFGTAFIVGFITYGLKDSLNSPKTEPSKSDLSKSKSSETEASQTGASKTEISKSEAPDDTASSDETSVTDDSGTQIPPSEVAALETEPTASTVEAPATTHSAES